MQTLAQGIDNLKLRLLALCAIPMAVTQAAMAVIEAEEPVYTGTYADAVVWQNEDQLDCRVFISGESLLASATQHSGDIEEMAISGRGMSIPMTPIEYIVGEPPSAHPTVPYPLNIFDEFYPLRIEAQGSPAYWDGQDMWLHAAAAAETTLNSLLAAVSL